MPNQTLSNPFVAGPPLVAGSPLFVGRQDLFRLLAAQQPPTLVLYGSRGAGKTSLLHQLACRLEESVVSVLVDVGWLLTCGAARTLRGKAKLIFNLAVHLHSTIAPLAPRLERPAPCERDWAAAPTNTLHAWLDRVETALGERRVLLALDDFERIGQAIDKGLLEPEVLNVFRSLILLRGRLILAFAVNGTPDKLGPRWPSYLIGAHPLKLGYLDKRAAWQLITSPTKGRIAYSPEAIARLLSATRGQPYLVQLVCSELIDSLNSPEQCAQESQARVELADVERAIERALTSGRLYFTSLWDDSTPAEQRILLALAKGAPFEPVAQVLAHLEQRDMIEPDDAGGWRFQVEMVHTWVKGDAR